MSKRRGSLYASLDNWTPKRAHGFAVRRLDKIEHLLIEIGACYGEVDGYVERMADEYIRGLKELREAIDGSMAGGRTL